jgi:tRNA threonylcarbamoyladenosine biosynthesis protein TsaB
VAVNVLALDTCDSRGSLAILRDQEVLGSAAHEPGEDYSSWILPTVERLLASSGMKIRDIELYAAASGPGSFTGIRVGLTSVKAWSEVYGGRIAGVSRLEAMASQAEGDAPYVAAFVDAHREQIFGALFRREGTGFERVDEEVVIAPQDFLSLVGEKIGAADISWISMDPAKLTDLPSWAERSNRGPKVQLSSQVLAPILGKLGVQRAREGKLVDALMLDAQYVRRSDAEIFWKGNAARG